MMVTVAVAMPYPEDVVAPVVDAVPVDASDVAAVVGGEGEKIVDERHHKRPYGSQSGN